MAVKNLNLIGQLEERCRELDIRLVYGELSGEGGLCRFRDSHVIIINRRTSTATRARIIADALTRVESETTAVRAAARDGATARTPATGTVSPSACPDPRRCPYIMSESSPGSSR